MASYEETAAWNIPPTKIRVLRNLLRLRHRFSVEINRWLETELKNLLARFRSNQWTLPCDLETEVPPSGLSNQLFRKTLARGVIVQLPGNILREAAEIGQLGYPESPSTAVELVNLDCRICL